MQYLYYLSHIQYKLFIITISWLTLMTIGYTLPLINHVNDITNKKPITNSARLLYHIPIMQLAFNSLKTSLAPQFCKPLLVWIILKFWITINHTYISIQDWFIWLNCYVWTPRCGCCDQPLKFNRAHSIIHFNNIGKWIELCESANYTLFILFMFNTGTKSAT